MQASLINNPPSTLSSHLLKADPLSTSSGPFDPEINSQQSRKRRWVILFLLCASTFGIYVISSILQNAQNEILKTFNINARTEMTQKQTIVRITWVVPLIAGLIIYHFGIHTAYRFFMRLYALGTILMCFSFGIESYSLYFWGELLMKVSSQGLFPTQMEMIIRYFRGKELSLAIGIVGSSKFIATVLGTEIYSSLMNKIGIQGVLCVGIVLCFLGDLAVNFLIKSEISVKKEDKEEVSSSRVIIIAFIVTILCFRVADTSKVIYMSTVADTMSSDLGKKFQLLSVFSPIILLPICGFFADIKGGRIIGVFLSFLMLFAGNISFFVFLDSESSLFHLTSFMLFKGGFCLFEASSWAVLGLSAPRKSLGVVLGSAQTLGSFFGSFCNSWLPREIRTLFFFIGFVLILGFGSMFCGWKILEREKIAAAKKIKL